VEAIRREIARLDPLVPMARPRVMEELVARDLAAHRFTLTLLGVFALVATLLAVVGLFGIVSWAVSQRTREIGVRLALGAEPRRIVSAVLRRGLLVAGAGTAGGVLASTAANRLLAGYLYEVAPTDPRVVLIVVGVFMATATLAAYLPARRAAAVDPVATLRSE
jgi:putative ABC transport system permease protein